MMGCDVMGAFLSRMVDGSSLFKHLRRGSQRMPLQRQLGATVEVPGASCEASGRSHQRPLEKSPKSQETASSFLFPGAFGDFRAAGCVLMSEVPSEPSCPLSVGIKSKRSHESSSEPSSRVGFECTWRLPLKLLVYSDEVPREFIRA